MVTTAVIQWLKLMRTLIRGIADDEDFRAVSLSVGLLLLTGTAFYAINQGWSVLDSFYFSVMTLTTIGYGDLAPEGTLAKLFTVVFALSGIGLLVAFGAEIARRSAAERKHRHSEDPT